MRVWAQVKTELYTDKQIGKTSFSFEPGGDWSDIRDSAISDS